MPTTTWDNLPAAKRDRVLDAAMVEFGRRGFSSGSLNVVAREAGVAKGSLFVYFTDKLDLFAHVCDACSQRVRDHMVERLASLGDQTPFFELMHWMVREWIAWFRDHPVERGVTYASNFEMDADVRSAVRQVTNGHYLDVLRPLTKTAVDRGELRDDTDSEALLALLLLLLPHLALAPFSPHLDPVLGLHGLDDEQITTPVTTLVDALERAFAPEASP
jgi:AcrR family transcriptional regulator